MADHDPLAERMQGLGEGPVPPLLPPDAVRARGEQRRRRATAGLAAGAGGVLLVVGLGWVALGDEPARDALRTAEQPTASPSEPSSTTSPSPRPSPSPSPRPSTSPSPTPISSPSPSAPAASPSPSQSASPEPAQWEPADAFLSPAAAAAAEEPGWAVVDGYRPTPYLLLDACPDSDQRYSEGQLAMRERQIASKREAGGSQLTQEVTSYVSESAAAGVFAEHVAELERCPSTPSRNDPRSTVEHEVVDRRAADGGQAMLVREQPCGEQGDCAPHFAFYVLVVQVGNGVTLAEYAIGEDGDPAEAARSLLPAVEQALRAAVPR